MTGVSKKFQNYNPPTAVDLVIEVYERSVHETFGARREMKGIVLIQRGNEPFKGQWALPGGFQEMGDSLEKTACKEAREETGLDLDRDLLEQLSVYSDAHRDPRGHVNSIGFVARAEGDPKGGDDAAYAKVFDIYKLPRPLAFDHEKRIREYFELKTRQGSMDSNWIHKNWKL